MLYLGFIALLHFNASSWFQHFPSLQCFTSLQCLTSVSRFPSLRRRGHIKCDHVFWKSFSVNLTSMPHLTSMLYLGCNVFLHLNVLSHSNVFFWVSMTSFTPMLHFSSTPMLQLLGLDGMVSLVGLIPECDVFTSWGGIAGKGVNRTLLT